MSLRHAGSTRRIVGASALIRPGILPGVIVLAVLAGAAATTRADGQAPPLPRSAPERQGVSSAALLEFVRAADRDLDAMHSVMILRHGHVIAEGWWAPYAPAIRHTMYSLTKSFTSTAIGLAVHEGRLSIDDPVVKFFPDEVPSEPTEFLKNLRVRDLLSMSTGHHKEPPLATSAQWSKTFLAAPIDHKPGTFFLYNTPASYMLSAILQKVTGEKTVEYLRPRLFQPLGIDDVEWETNPEGITIGGYGLHLRTESLARFGQLYLQKGTWQGRQILQKDWVEAATSRQVSNGSNPASDWDQGYGFQFWRTRQGTYRGDGAFGQFCLVLPAHDAVVVITSGVKSMQAVLDLVFAKLVPAFGTPIAADAKAERALREALAGLALHPPTGTGTPGAGIPWGRRFEFQENADRIESVALERGADGTPSILMRVGGSDERFAAPSGRWATGRLAKPASFFGQLVATSGVWTGDATFAATFAFYETPFKQHVRFAFSGDTVTLERDMHVAFGETKRPTLVGRAR